MTKKGVRLVRRSVSSPRPQLLISYALLLPLPVGIGANGISITVLHYDPVLFEH